MATTKLTRSRSAATALTAALRDELPNNFADEISSIENAVMQRIEALESVDTSTRGGGSGAELTDEEADAIVDRMHGANMR